MCGSDWVVNKKTLTFVPSKGRFVVKIGLPCFVGKGSHMHMQSVVSYQALFSPPPREPGDEANVYYDSHQGLIRGRGRGDRVAIIYSHPPLLVLFCNVTTPNLLWE